MLWCNLRRDFLADPSWNLGYGIKVTSFFISCGVEDFVYAGYDAINVLGRGLPVANADSHGATAVPGGSGEEGFSGGEDLCDDAVGECVVVGCGRAFARVFVRIVEADEALIDLRLPDELGSFEGTDSGYESVGVVAGALDQVGYTLSA
jgi:hypothetical protein